MLTLITGGARSGKSTFAQTLCENAGRVVYIATARPDDPEMHTRVARHRRSRPASWTTIEEPVSVAEAVSRCAGGADFVLIDCITLWVSNLLFDWRDSDENELESKVRQQVSSLVRASQGSVNVIAVTNEVGSGIVPESAVARHFRDLQGFVNQQLAQSADRVYLVVSGIPMSLKPAGEGRQ